MGRFITQLETHAEKAFAVDLIQRTASPISHIATVIPLESPHSEWLAIQPFDLGQIRTDMDARAGPPSGTLTEMNLLGIPAACFIFPHDCEPPPRLVGENIAPQLTFAFGPADVPEYHVRGTECLNESAVADRKSTRLNSSHTS